MLKKLYVKTNSIRTHTPFEAPTELVTADAIARNWRKRPLNLIDRINLLI